MFSKKSTTTVLAALAVAAGLLQESVTCANSLVVYSIPLYEQDFTADPMWTTDDPIKMGWDEASGTWSGRQVNTEGTYAYTQVPKLAPNRSWTLEFDRRIVECDWSAGMDFGLYSADLLYWPNSAVCHLGIVDAGSVVGFYGGAKETSTTAPWLRGVWYRNVIAYDSAQQLLSTTITDRETGEVIASLTLEKVSFPEDMNRIGLSRLHAKDTGPGAGPWATVEYSLDNVRLSQQLIVQVPPSGNWRNHGEYVSAVAKAADEFLAEGLISPEEKNMIVSEAAKSQVGKAR